MKAVLVIGSNIGNRVENIKKAICFLENYCMIIRQSGVYESKDCLGSGKRYMNCVLELETLLNEDILSAEIKKYELSAGRTIEGKKRGEVAIDIDIVIWENTILRPSDFNSLYFKLGFTKLKKHCL